MSDELDALGRFAGDRGRTTKKLAAERPIPRESKVAFAVGAGLALVCASALVVRAFTGGAQPLQSQGRVAPAITSPPKPEPPKPADETETRSE